MLQIVCLKMFDFRSETMQKISSAIRALGTDMIGKRETDSSGSHKASTRGRLQCGHQHTSVMGAEPDDGGMEQIRNYDIAMDKKDTISTMFGLSRSLESFIIGIAHMEKYIGRGFVFYDAMLYSVVSDRCRIIPDHIAASVWSLLPEGLREIVLAVSEKTFYGRVFSI